MSKPRPSGVAGTKVKSGWLRKVVGWRVGGSERRVVGRIEGGRGKRERRREREMNERNGEGDSARETTEINVEEEGGRGRRGRKEGGEEEEEKTSKQTLY